MIIGAGIVGCYLGSKLGDCEIWEKQKSIAEKPCSGLLSKEGIDYLKLPTEDCILNEIKGSVIKAGNQIIKVEKQHAVAYVLDRLQLQKNLIQEAQDANCKLKYCKQWNSETDNFIIGADGALSEIAKSIELKQRNYIYTYQVTANHTQNPDFVQLYLNHDYAPGFFAWIIPLDEKTARIGIGVKQGNPREKFEQFLKTENCKLQNITKPQAGIIPIFDPKTRTVRSNIAIVGDAAGQVKATTGGGIIFGCKCALELKKAMDHGDLRLYEKSWRKKYENDLNTHLKIRKFLDKINYNELFTDLKKSKIENVLTEYGDMDHPRALKAKLIRNPRMWKYLLRYLL